jgi:hypothetical protein
VTFPHAGPGDAGVPGQVAATGALAVWGREGVRSSPVLKQLLRAVGVPVRVLPGVRVGRSVVEMSRASRLSGAWHRAPNLVH